MLIDLLWVNLISFSEMKIIEHWGMQCFTYFMLLKVHLFFAYVELTDMKVVAGWNGYWSFRYWCHCRNTLFAV